MATSEVTYNIKFDTSLLERQLAELGHVSREATLMAMALHLELVPEPSHEEIAGLVRLLAQVNEDTA